MKSYKNLTFKYLKNQRKRTMLTIFGVILSIALITAIGTMLLTLQNSEIEGIKKDYGFYHVKFTNIEEQNVSKLGMNTKIEAVGYTIDGGYAELPEEGFIKVSGYDAKAQGMFYLKAIQGRMPQKPNEIALEKWIIENSKGSLKIGGKIKLNIQDRKEGEILGKIFKDIPLNNKAASAKGEFTITGIMDNSAASQAKKISLGVVTPGAIEELKARDNLRCSVFVRIKKGLDIQRSISDISNGFGINKKDIDENSRLLSVLGQSSSAQTNNSIFMVMAFLVALIVIATAAVIYNSFHISVLERIRQFGVLRSIGTTPDQIRGIVVREAIVVALIALPLGLVSGVLAVKIVIALLNLSKFSIVSGLETVVSPEILLVSSIVGVISVIFSALSPAVMAGRVSPIQAIMNTKGYKKPLSRVKGNRLMRRIFGISGEMASKNLRRNRKRFFITVFSMCIGIIIFLVFNTFTYYTFEGLHGRDGYTGDYEIYTNSSGADYNQKDFNDLKSIAGVSMVYKNVVTNCAITFSKDKVTNDYIENLKSNYKSKLKIMEDGKNIIPFGTSLIFGYDQSELDKCRENLVSGTLDEKRLNAESGVILAPNIEVVVKKENKHAIIKTAELKVGDYIYIDMKGDILISRKNANGLKRFKIMGIVDKIPFDYPYPGVTPSVITTESIFKNITGIKKYNGFSIELTPNADKEAVKKKVTDIAQRVLGGRIIDFHTMAEQQNQARITILILMYGFVVVIALIGALNIVNTISTNLILRTREFGTLRAVGMTMEQMKRMIIMEGILYGLIGTFWGSIIGTALSYWLYKIMTKLLGMMWVIPGKAIAIAAFGTIGITLLSTLVPLKRVSNMNIIEAIGREE